jgi:hypothetical protein
MSMNLEDIELYDEQNIKVNPSTLTSILNPPSPTMTPSPTSRTLQYMRIILNYPSRLSKIVIINRNGINGDVVRTINDINQELSNTIISGNSSVYRLYYDVNTGLNVLSS